MRITQYWFQSYPTAVTLWVLLDHLGLALTKLAPLFSVPEVGLTFELMKTAAAPARIRAGERGRNKQTSKLMEATFQSEDAVPDNVCLRCGMPGPHPRWRNCVDALRDRLADVRG